MKKFTGTGVALAVFGALLVWLLWYQPKTKDERDEAKKTVVKAEREKIDRIEVTNATGAYVFEKKGDAWLLTSPRNAPAEDAVTSQMLNALAELIATDLVWKDPTAEQKKLAGLDPPAITVKYRAGGKEQTLLIGKAHSREDGYYVSAAKGPVYMGRKWSLDPFAKSLEDFRRKKLFVFDKDDVRTISIGAVELSRADSISPWHTAGKPFEGRADRGKVNGMLTRATALKAKAWLAPETQLDARYEMRIGLTSGEEHRLLVGQDRGSGEWLARVGTSGEIVVTADPRPLDDPKEIASWKDPQLYDFVVDDVSKLTVEVDGQTVVVTRDEDRMWKAGTNVVNAEATAFLRDAKLAKAIETSSEAKGTNSPVVKATWVTPTQTLELVLGDPKTGTKPVQRWIKTNESPRAALVQEDLLSHARALKDAAMKVEAATTGTSGKVNVTVDKGT